MSRRRGTAIATTAFAVAGSLLAFAADTAKADAVDTPGVWDSYTAATFDLRPLTATTAEDLYKITDGDVDCTPEIESNYTYEFNFFEDVSIDPNLPSSCAVPPGAAVQYGVQGAQCHTIGIYDSEHDDEIWSLLDKSSDADPSKGVTLSYLEGDYCSALQAGRKLTINVECANHHYRMMSAVESGTCEYEIDVQSYYGCPQECPITANGLCDGHGLCMMEQNEKTHGAPHCYCNTGWKGDSCDVKTHHKKNESSDPAAVQIAFLVILIVIFSVLVAAVIYMTLQVTKFRKETRDSFSGSNPGEIDVDLGLRNGV